MHYTLHPDVALLPRTALFEHKSDAGPDSSSPLGRPTPVTKAGHRRASKKKARVAPGANAESREKGVCGGGGPRSRSLQAPHPLSLSRGRGAKIPTKEKSLGSPSTIPSAVQCSAVQPARAPRATECTPPPPGMQLVHPAITHRPPTPQEANGPASHWAAAVATGTAAARTMHGTPAGVN